MRDAVCSQLKVILAFPLVLVDQLLKRSMTKICQMGCNARVDYLKLLGCITKSKGVTTEVDGNHVIHC
jgi:hypothetical protein